MNINLAAIHFAMLAALAVLPGAVLAQQKPRHDEPMEVVAARVPGKARAKRNPFASDPEAAGAGKKLFEQHCAECHGETAEGTKRGPGLRTNGVLQATPGEIFWIVANGVVRRGMPAWSKLPEPQRWQIIAFLTAMHRDPQQEGRADGPAQGSNPVPGR